MHTAQRTTSQTARPQRAAPYSLIPSELKGRAQWVVFTLTPPDAKGKRKKKPLDPQTGEWSSTPNGPAIWLSFGDAVQLEQSTPAHFRNRVDGIGYVFTSDCPYAGIDLDDCYHGGKLDDRAHAIVASLDSYTEISISGRGVKAIVKATVAVNPSLVRGVEVYGASGFFALTGKHLHGTPRTIEPAQAVIEALIQQFSPVPAHAAQNERSAAKAHNERATITDNPIAAYNQAFDVSTIVERCGGRADGRKLYHCPCGVHTGASGSLLMKKSPKHGAVVRGLNPACVFYNRDSAAFDAMRFLEHGGDRTDAITAARVALAMPIQGEKRPLAFAPKRPAPPAARIVENVNAVMSDVLSRAARDEGLKKSERRVLNTLIDHAPDGIARLSVQHVASLTRESESSVQRATRALNGRYFVKHEDANEYGGNLANVYQFIKILTPPPVNDTVSRSKRDFDTPLTLIESKGGDNLTHELNINHGTAFEQIPQILQPEPAAPCDDWEWESLCALAPSPQPDEESYMLPNDESPPSLSSVAQPAAGRTPNESQTETSPPPPPAPNGARPLPVFGPNAAALAILMECPGYLEMTQEESARPPIQPNRNNVSFPPAPRPPAPLRPVPESTHRAECESVASAAPERIRTAPRNPRRPMNLSAISMKGIPNDIPNDVPFMDMDAYLAALAPEGRDDNG